MPGGYRKKLLLLSILLLPRQMFFSIYLKEAQIRVK